MEQVLTRTERQRLRELSEIEKQIDAEIIQRIFDDNRPPLPLIRIIETRMISLSKHYVRLNAKQRHLMKRGNEEDIETLKLRKLETYSRISELESLKNLLEKYHTTGRDISLY